MIALLRQNLTRLIFKDSTSFGKSDAVSSLPLLHFSTSAVNRPSVYEFLVHNHHFSPKLASEIASVVPRLRNPQKSDSVLSFLKESGFSRTQLEETVKSRPQLLSANLEKFIKPKVKIFHDFGLSATDVAEIISNDPSILQHSLERRFMSSISLLKNMFGSNELARFLKASSWYLKTNLNNNLVPNVEFLNKCGVSMNHINWLMHRFPRVMLRKPEDMKKFVNKADEFGVSRNSKRFIHAVRILSAFSDKTWEFKLRTLRELGFLDNDILFAFRNCPLVFGLSVERLKEAKEVLLANGKYDLSCIVNCPTSLLYSIEKRHKPRIQVLELLDRKNLIKSWPALSTFCTMSDKKFYDKYVGPFEDEIGGVCMTKGATV